MAVPILNGLHHDYRLAAQPFILVCLLAVLVSKRGLSALTCTHQPINEAIINQSGAVHVRYKGNSSAHRLTTHWQPIRYAC